MMIKLIVENVVFCEFVRAEQNGKYTLLGAAAPEWNILPTTSATEPAIVTVSVFVEGKPTATGPFSAEIRVIDAENKQVIRGSLAGDFSTSGATSVTLGPLPLQVEKEGDYLFEWNFGNEWDEIGKLRITRKALS